MDSNGWIYLYYLGWTVGSDMNKVVVAVSVDAGNTWAYKLVTLSGFDGMASPVDPDVRILPDGTFRMYVTSDPNDGQGPRTYRAEGTNGFHFTNQGVAFSQSGKKVLDPSIAVVGGTWHLFAGGNTTSSGGNWHATSADGQSFTNAEDNLVTAYQGNPCALSNAVDFPGGHRFYGFTRGAASIVSFWSTDGWTWTEEAGYRLQVDVSTGMEKGDVKDAAVVRLEDGTYLMVYVTEIP